MSYMDRAVCGKTQSLVRTAAIHLWLRGIGVVPFDPLAVEHGFGIYSSLTVLSPGAWKVFSRQRATCEITQLGVAPGVLLQMQV